MSTISRREFLKLSGAGLAGAFLPSLAQPALETSERHGRVLETKVHLYAYPSFKSQVLDTYWKDSILSITEATIGDDDPPFNRNWYVIGAEGYVHSGGIQPVDVRLNSVVTEFPALGAVAEVTVPFTDAHWGPAKSFPVAYRMYYETTHWVIGLVYDSTGMPWYNVAEDKWQLTYYIPAAHLRIIPPDELAPISPDVPAHARRLEVRTPEQVIIAYEYDRPVFMARTATGARFSNGNFSTPPGRHITAQKRPSRHMAAGNLAANGYDLPGVPWISYITESGISFHGTYWHNNFGRPRSHGCINLTAKSAKWVYRWTTPVVPPGEQYIFAESGTIVDVI